MLQKRSKIYSKVEMVNYYYQFISGQCSYFILPENFRKPLVFYPCGFPSLNPVKVYKAEGFL